MALFIQKGGLNNTSRSSILKYSDSNVGISLSRESGIVMEVFYNIQRCFCGY
ncbi:hypothetical protein SK128_025931, partial [Halocaridina rubra]